MNGDSLFDGPDDEGTDKDDRLLRQIERVYRLMSDGVPRSLAEIGDEIDAPEGSVSARLRDLRKPQWGGHDVRREHLGDGLYLYQLVPSEMGLLDGDKANPYLRHWRECEPIRFCVAHHDFHPPVPTMLPDGSGCSPLSWRKVRVLCEAGSW